VAVAQRVAKLALYRLTVEREVAKGSKTVHTTAICGKNLENWFTI
jgi:hypothetical protein